MSRWQNAVQRTKVLATVSATVTAIAIFSPVAANELRSGEVKACSGPNDNAIAEIQLSEARDIWTVFPAMLQAPELLDLTGPATVVVYDGPFSLRGLTAVGDPMAALVTDVICVYPANDYPHIYFGVSRAGSRWQAP